LKIKYKKGKKFEREYNEKKLNEIGSYYAVASGQVGYNDKIVPGQIVAFSEPKKPKGRSSSSKSILFLGDIHCGSIYAPCSLEPELLTTKTTWNPTALQKQCLEYWLETRDQLIQKPFLTVINGEPVDGDNIKEVGGPTWSSDVNDQIVDFLKLMKMYPKPKHVTMTRGSAYHVMKGYTSFEDQVARELNVEPYEVSKQAEKRRIWSESRNAEIVIDDIVNFEIHGKVFNVAHHIGFNRAYHNKSQALTAMLAEMEFARGKYWTNDKFPAVFARAHVHYYVMVAFARVKAFTGPTYKLSMDRFMTKSGVPSPPSIGNVEVIVEPNGHILIEPHIITNDIYPKYNIQEF